MIYLDWNKYQQKPRQWGPLSAVRSAVFRNAERLAVDPASLVAYFPMWEGAFPLVNLISGKFNSGGIGPGASATGLGIYLNNQNNSTELPVDGYSFADNTPFWFSFGAHQPTHETTNNSLIAGYNNSTGLDYIGLYGGDYLRVRFETSLLFTAINNFTKSTNLAIRCDGATTANVYAYQDGKNKQTLTVANSALKLNHLGLASTSYGATDTHLSQWIAGTGHISDGQVARLHETPYALLAPSPQPVIFDMGAGGGYTLTAGGGTYTLTGQTASLLRNNKLSAGSGSYALTGQTAGLLLGRLLSAGGGSVDLTGQSASLLKDSKVSAGAGSVLVTGSDASLLKDSVLSAGAGAVEITGYDVTLTYTPLGGYTLSAESGSFTLAGSDASLLMGRKLAAESGSITLDGQTADLLFNRLLASDAGTFTITGADAEFLRDYKLAAGAGSITLSGQAVTLDYSGLELPNGKVSITFTVKQPSTTFSVSAPTTTFTVH
jgi:hypothetical protein